MGRAWSPQSHREEPFGEPEPDTAIIDAEFARDIGSRVMCHYITHYDLPELEKVHEWAVSDSSRRRYRRVVREASSVVAVVGVPLGAYADQDEIKDAKAGTASSTAVRIGQLPGSVADAQQSLGECESVST